MWQPNLLGAECPNTLDCRNYLTSAALHVAGIALLVLIPASVREPVPPSRVVTPLVAPRLQPWRARLRPQPLPRPKPIVVQRAFSIPVVKTVRPVIEPPAPPQISAPAIQSAPLRTAEIQVRPPAPPAVQVHTGVFGDPLGAVASHATNAKLTPVRLGSFDGSAAGDLHAAGGHSGRGLVADAGFGDGAGSGGSGTADRGRRAASIVQAGFGDVEAGGGTAQHARATAPVASTPVRILYKPKPVYTPEARAMKLEGNVLLEVVFRASGQVQIERVVRGLDHQLDQAAEQAAQKIRFQPATRAGVPVDTRATVNITFELT